MSAPLSLICENLISTLRARREYLGMSQEEVGEAIGLVGYARRSVISDWERGKYTPNMRNLIAWAQALDLFVRLIPHEGRQRRGGRIEPHRGSQIHKVEALFNERAA